MDVEPTPLQSDDSFRSSSTSPGAGSSSSSAGSNPPTPLLLGDALLAAPSPLTLDGPGADAQYQQQHQASESEPVSPRPDLKETLPADVLSLLYKELSETGRGRDVGAFRRALGR